MIASWKENNDKPGQGVEKQRHYSTNKGPYSQGYGFPRGHIQLWELDHKEGRMPNNWCLQTVLLERTPENPLTERRWTSQSEGRSMLNTPWKDWYWSWSSSILVIWCGQMTHEKSLMLGKIEGRRRRGHQRTRLLMLSSIQWTWTWAKFGTWWGTGRPGMLKSMGLQRVGHDWVTEQQKQI